MSHLAIDLGAGSGRVIRGSFRGGFRRGKLVLEEVHRFSNPSRVSDGHERWDIDHLLKEIRLGLKKASKKRAVSVGVDTWGVDFVMLDEKGDPIEQPVTYRDKRTEGAVEKFLQPNPARQRFSRLNRRSLYDATGIQLLPFNTVFQLASLLERDPRALDGVSHLLMMPDYFHYRLSGKISTEFTNASTTQMLSRRNQRWDSRVLKAFSFRPSVLPEPVRPGTVLGKLLPEMARSTGLGRIQVIAPATHDTGSAVVSVPVVEDGKGWAFISSGTWSLVGMEVGAPICTRKALDFNFSNEGGVGGTYRFLKNVMGLWIVTGLARELAPRASFEKIEKMAGAAEGLRWWVDPNDLSFLNPKSMKKAFDSYFKKTGQKRPDRPEDYLRSAFDSLAFAYRQVLAELHQCQPKKVERVHIIGGGSCNRLLNQLTADATGLPVHAGPVEGTAIGNILVQAQALRGQSDLSEARRLVRRSFKIEEFRPRPSADWQVASKKFQEMKRFQEINKRGKS